MHISGPDGFIKDALSAKLGEIQNLANPLVFPRDFLYCYLVSSHESMIPTFPFNAIPYPVPYFSPWP